jgi:hypothetical protein
MVLPLHAPAMRRSAVPSSLDVASSASVVSINVLRISVGADDHRGIERGAQIIDDTWSHT